MSSGQHKILWMGDLDPWMDEGFIKSLFASMGDKGVSVKLMRDKNTGLAAGYCFLEFQSHATALRHLSTLNGTLIPGTQKSFKLNWSSGSGSGFATPSAIGLSSTPAVSGRMSAEGDYPIFVGDLGNEVKDGTLMALFQSRYQTVRSAKVVIEPSTGLSKGYGFVRFGDEKEQQRAMMEMQGVVCGTRAIRISAATQKYRQTYNLQLHTSAITQPSAPSVYVGYTEPDATVYMGNLPPNATEDDIRNFFAGYGDVVAIKIPSGRGCAFIQFALRQNATLAINNMNGFLLCMFFLETHSLGGSRVKLSWGKGINPNIKPGLGSDSLGSGFQQTYSQQQSIFQTSYAQPQQGYPQSAYPQQAYAQGYAQGYAQQGYAQSPYPATPTTPHTPTHVSPERRVSKKQLYDPLAPVPMDTVNAKYLSDLDAREESTGPWNFCEWTLA